jgi:hypothetical protein
MLKERGKMKWHSAAFLLEHTDSLKQFFKDYEYKTKPELTEEKLTEINDILLEAMEFNQIINTTYYDNKSHQISIVTGNLHYIDEYKQELRIMDLHNSLHKLKFTNIIDVGIN